LKFIEIGGGITGLVAQVKKPSMDICLAGVSTAEFPACETKIKTSVLKWVDAMRPLTGDELTSAVKVYLDYTGCGGAGASENWCLMT
jgi:hypothetical protein